MTLRARVRFAAIIYCLLAVSVVGAMMIVNESVKSYRSQVDAVYALREQVSGLRSAGFEYIQWGHERPKIQAESAIANIRNLSSGLEKKVSSNKYALDKQLSAFKVEVDETELTLRHLYEDRTSATQTGREERSIELFLLRMQSLVGSVNFIEEPLNQQVADAAELQRYVLLLVAALLLLSAASILWLLEQWVIKPLNALERAIKAFNVHNPTSPIDVSPYSAEFAEVIAVFNESAERLIRTTVSRDALEQEIQVRQRAEEEVRDAYVKLQNSQAQLIQMEKLSALGTLVGGVAHEINNPLMGLSGYIDYGVEHSEPGRTKEFLQKARSEVDRIQRLVKNMLIFTRIKRVRSEDRCAVQTMINRTFELLDADFIKQDICVTVEAPDIEVIVDCSEDSLQQTLLNLLINARDALAEVLLPRKISIVVSTEDSQWASISVCDNGAGVNAENRLKIFSPFFTTKSPGKGTGLGLAVSHQMVVSAGGVLELAPPCNGGGACFIIKLGLITPQEHIQ